MALKNFLMIILSVSQKFWNLDTKFFVTNIKSAKKLQILYFWKKWKNLNFFTFEICNQSKYFYKSNAQMLCVLEYKILRVF